MKPSLGKRQGTREDKIRHEHSAQPRVQLMPQAETLWTIEEIARKEEEGHQHVGGRTSGRERYYRP